MEAWKDELYHHGIKGQKWGIRRYQNDDGSLTAAGRKRYGDAAESASGQKGNSKKTSEKNSPEAIAKRKARAKKAAIIGGSVIAAGLAVYGAKKLNDKAVSGLSKKYRDMADHSMKLHSSYLDLAKSSGRSIDRVKGYSHWTEGMRNRVIKGYQSEVNSYGQEAARQLELYKRYANRSRSKYGAKEKIRYLIGNGKR